jgi:hypothetical protein
VGLDGLRFEASAVRQPTEVMIGEAQQPAAGSRNEAERGHRHVVAVALTDPDPASGDTRRLPEGGCWPLEVVQLPAKTTSNQASSNGRA